MPEYHHIVRACTSAEHTLRLMHLKADPMVEEDFDEVYWSVYLNPHPWQKRLWIAVRYVFGHRSKYGDWDSGPSMETDTLDQLHSFLANVKTPPAVICQGRRTSSTG